MPISTLYDIQADTFSMQISMLIDTRADLEAVIHADKSPLTKGYAARCHC